MAKNDDYNPENDPRYAIDKATANRAYWEQRRKAHPISVGSIGVARRKDLEATLNYLTPEIIAHARSLSFPVTSIRQNTVAKKQFLFMAGYREIKGVPLDQCNSKTIGNEYKKVHERVLKGLNEDDGTVPF